MVNPWKVAFVVVVGVVVVILGLRGWDWRRVTNDRGWKAEQVEGYLAAPIKLPDGRVFSRAEIIDAMIGAAIAQAPKAEEPKK